MSAATKLILTAQEYLNGERAAATKSEFYRGETFAMAGASPQHVRINTNLIAALGAALGDGPCYTLSNDMRVFIAAHEHYVYPDTIVLCEDPTFQPGTDDCLTNPKIIFEILSPSTERYDRGMKFDHYRSLESLQEYLLVSQDRMLVEHYTRQPDGQWLFCTWEGPSAVLALQSVSATLSVAALYRGVVLPESLPLR
jgi:Uma2 family endonuclease